VNPDCDLDSLIHYNRQRAVIQALLRNPRDEQLKVGLYLSGDMSHLDYPKDLLGRVVTTNGLLEELEKAYPDEFINNRSNQIELLARIITGFVDGKITKSDISEAIKNFKFIDPSKKSVKVQVDTSELSPIHQYLFYSWLETLGKNGNNLRTQRMIVDRLAHIDNCIEEKGYVDIKADKIGKRPEWKKWVDFLVDKKYLKPEKRKEQGRRSKTIYVPKSNL